MAIRTNYTSDEIYELMKVKVNEFTSNKPTFWGNGSVAGGFFRAISYFVELLQLQINLAYLAFRIKTADGGFLLRRLSDFGMTANPQVFAIAPVTFYGDLSRTTDLTIPAGTIVKTNVINGDTKFYSLMSDLLLPLSQESVQGLCLCTVAGTYGNTAIHTINQLSVPITGIGAVDNLEEVVNGAESETVEQMRARLPLFLLGLKKGNNDAILNAVYSVSGVSIANITENHPANGNYTIFVSTETGIVDSVLIDKIKYAVDQVKGLCITYSIITPIISPITIAMSLNINSQIYNQADLSNIILLKIKSYINNSNKSSVLISDIVALVKSITGVLDIQNVIINGVSANLILNETYVAKIQNNTDITLNII